MDDTPRPSPKFFKDALKIGNVQLNVSFIEEGGTALRTTCFLTKENCHGSHKVRNEYDLLTTHVENYLVFSIDFTGAKILKFLNR